MFCELVNMTKHWQQQCQYLIGSVVENSSLYTSQISWAYKYHCYGDLLLAENTKRYIINTQ